MDDWQKLVWCKIWSGTQKVSNTTSSVCIDVDRIVVAIISELVVLAVIGPIDVLRSIEQRVSNEMFQELF